MTAIIDMTAADRPIFTITRDFDAPRELVWQAITDPKQVAVWYGGPGFTNPVCEMDLRSGGTWHHVMQVRPTVLASQSTASLKKSSNRSVWCGERSKISIEIPRHRL
jgi:hypothetical protein